MGDVTPIPTLHMQVHSSLRVCTMSEHVLCDGCDREGPTVHAPSDDLVAEARVAAAAEGWRTNAPDDRDICPACLARTEHNP